ncbi:MAG: hypothetical protein KGY99_03370 [Phycisphaerae bacterium]|nr:hypothetical protein [Phycisphaerae bacterium]
MKLTHRHLHLLEKIQVQLAAVAGVVLVYFALWPVLRPSDPRDPVVFFVLGAPGSAAMFAGALWVLAAVAAVLTVHARPEGALMAAVLGVGGVSLRSPQMRGLLWAWSGPLRNVFGWLIAELALLAALLFVAALIVDLVRRGIAAVRPQWLHKDVLAAGASADGKQPIRALLGFLPPWRDGRWRPADASRTLAAMGLGLVVSVALLVLLLRSPERGQILFALLAAFLLGAMAAHQLLPEIRSAAIVCLPLLAGLGFYVLSMVAVPGGVDAWKSLPHYACILPVDWLTAGGGGTLIGYWMSERLHELRHIEKKLAGLAEA